MNKYEIVCGCGDHVALDWDENLKCFRGYCIGCDKIFSILVTPDSEHPSSDDLTKAVNGL